MLLTSCNSRSSVGREERKDGSKAVDIVFINTVVRVRLSGCSAQDELSDLQNSNLVRCYTMKWKSRERQMRGDE